MNQYLYGPTRTTMYVLAAFFVLFGLGFYLLWFFGAAKGEAIAAWLVAGFFAGFGFLFLFFALRIPQKSDWLSVEFGNGYIRIPQYDKKPYSLREIKTEHIKKMVTHLYNQSETGFEIRLHNEEKFMLMKGMFHPKESYQIVKTEMEKRLRYS
jgi:hypothetical protein